MSVSAQNREESAVDLRVATLTAEVVELLRELTPDRRLEVFSVLTAGYCTECGAADPSCQCWNDE